MAFTAISFHKIVTKPIKKNLRRCFYSINDCLSVFLSWVESVNRQMKLAETRQYIFWKLTPKQVFGASFKFFDPPTTKWRSFKFFAKFNGNHILMTNFSKLRKYQIFGLIELHNVSKGQLADRIFKLWKSCVYD